MTDNGEEATHVVFEFGEKVLFSPPLWPGKKLDAQPGDLSQFAPHGTGLYGYQNTVGANPIESAPIHEPRGGVVYFDSKVTQEDFLAALRLMGIESKGRRNDYAVFLADSEQPGEDHYLQQIRIVPKFALRYMFDAITEAEYKSFAEQSLSIDELLWLFIMKEKERWGTHFWDDKGLEGKFGGDGDFAREELAFGILLENEYYGVYRIWSRAWLVTK